MLFLTRESPPQFHARFFQRLLFLAHEMPPFICLIAPRHITHFALLGNAGARKKKFRRSAHHCHQPDYIFHAAFRL